MYLLLRRVLGLFRSDDRAAAEAELEDAILRHQVGILCRQVKRPVYRTSDKAFLAATSRMLRREAWGTFLSVLRLSSAGTGSSSQGSGRDRTALQDVLPWTQRFESSSSGWAGRTQGGATCGFVASS